VHSACNKQESRQVIGQHVRCSHLSTAHRPISDSQADSAGSIPVTRSTREKRCRSWGFVKSVAPLPVGPAHPRAPLDDQWAIRGPSVGHRLPCQHPPSGSGSCSQSEDGKGRQQLLSRLKQRLGVLNSSLRLVMRGRLAGPSGVLELVSSSPHRPKGPEPVAELGTESHLDYIVPA
jgi:hypothetical protein